MMKKLAALLLAVMMLACSASLAEETTIAVEEVFEGVWVQFEDGFEIYLPAEWLEVEVTEEMLLNGIFYAAINPEGTQLVQIGWEGLEAEPDLAALAEAMKETCPDAQVIVINGIEMLMYTEVETDTLTLAARDAAEPGLYLFGLTPASDPDFVEVGTAIACSIRNIAE